MPYGPESAENLRPLTDRNRPSVGVDAAYALISLGSAVIWSVLSGWLLYFYLPPDGIPRVPVALYGGVMFALYAANASIAPLVGYLSDHTRSRWGRRLPYMFASALPMLIFFSLLWTPPAPGESIWNLLYLAVVLELYYLAYGLIQIPYAALLPELALTDHHRVRMAAWSSGFLLVGVILSGFAGPLIEKAGYVIAMLIYAAASLPLFYAPFLVLRERPGRQIVAAQRQGFRQNLGRMLRNRPFRVLIVAGVFYWSATAFTQAVVPYIVTEICLLTKADTPYFYIPAVLGSLACYPLVTRLSHRWGKWQVFVGSLFASAAVLPGLLVIGPWFPLPLIIQGILWITLQAIAMSGVIILPSAFAAEITDYDAQQTGQRREGAYYAFWGVLDQLVKGTAAAVLPLVLLLGRSHADPLGPLGVRLIGPLGGALLLAAGLVFLRYPLRSPLPGAATASVAPDTPVAVGSK